MKEELVEIEISFRAIVKKDDVDELRKIINHHPKRLCNFDSQNRIESCHNTSLDICRTLTLADTIKDSNGKDFSEDYKKMNFTKLDDELERVICTKDLYPEESEEGKWLERRCDEMFMRQRELTEKFQPFVDRFLIEKIDEALELYDSIEIMDNEKLLHDILIGLMSCATIEVFPDYAYLGSYFRPDNCAASVENSEIGYNLLHDYSVDNSKIVCYRFSSGTIIALV